MLSILRRAAEIPIGPVVYFDFCGTSSGILLPPFPKLPSGGLTVAMWLRCEAFTHPQVPASVPYEPCVFALCDDSGAGVSLKFSENFLMIEALAVGAKVSYRVCFHFIPKFSAHVCTLPMVL